MPAALTIDSPENWMSDCGVQYSVKTLAKATLLLNTELGREPWGPPAGQRSSALALAGGKLPRISRV